MAYMKDSTGRRLDGFPVAAVADMAPRPQTIVFLGDSLSEQGGMIPAAPAIKVTSPWPWAMSMLGQRFKVLKNAGIGGQTTAQILSRFDTDVTALAPGWVHILAGTNDMGNAGTAVAKANILAMLAKADAAKIRVILGTLPPRLPANYTTAQVKTDTLELNRWIIATARTRPNVVLVDYFAALADVNGQYRALTAGWNPTSDGVHLSATGGFAAGLALFAALDKITTPLATFLPAQGVGLNLLPNPDMTAGAANVAPTSWTAAGTAAAAAAWSVVERDGFPNAPWRQVVIANGGGTLTLSSNANVPANGISVGDSVVAYMDFEASGLDPAAVSGSQGFFIRVKAWNGASYTNTFATLETYNAPVTARKGTFYVCEFAIPTGTTTMTLEVYIVGGGTYRIGRAGLYKSDTFS